MVMPAHDAAKKAHASSCSTPACTQTQAARGAHLADKEEDVLGTHRRPRARRARPPQLAARRRAVHGLRQAGSRKGATPGRGSKLKLPLQLHS